MTDQFQYNRSSEKSRDTGAQKHKHSQTVTDPLEPARAHGNEPSQEELKRKGKI
ncbi:hypothetical protein CC1G_00675 [Coprinopsis cinerea okayama7|uniref:Uncharacterized protein n=1 Tax=Coprinopsis cinerea (strain Okayama-7 / 130 / ATCC MYA-4618 / FGSC 9003) TaxID=240176 RepID=A8N3N0_COPC7|nr:hypothetical protein CC1G_00675 [Coprinopsis cinerea okayama7\|eukprot:XP_001829496.1 hypothetical protein CC1G_00675 [Coprinopsis cinerea okayama7\